eukprot:6172906-Pleurochrysis_carterae.AAC.2
MLPHAGHGNHQLSPISATLSIGIAFRCGFFWRLQASARGAAVNARAESAYAQRAKFKSTCLLVSLHALCPVLPTSPGVALR